MRVALVLGSLVGLVGSSVTMGQGVRLDTDIRFEHTEMTSALEDAKDNYDGDLLIYLFQPENGNHEAMVTNALNNDSLSQYVNSNFARIAIDTSTDEGSEILSTIRKGFDLPDWDFVALQKPDGRVVQMHGLENTGVGNSSASWLQRLQEFKGFGGLLAVGEEMRGVPLRSVMTEVYAPDSASTYTLLNVASVVAGHEVEFTGEYFDPNGTFGIGLPAGTKTPFVEKFVAEELIGLFKSLDPDVGIVVTLQTVEDNSVVRQVAGQWDFVMVMKHGDEVLTSGL